MTFIARESAAPASGEPRHLTLVETARRDVSARAAEASELAPFAVEVQRRDHVAVVQPGGELDLATLEMLATAVDAAIAETLRATQDGMESPARLVLDLRGLTFIGSTGLHLLVELHRRSRREGFQLTLIAPLPPVDRAIQLCGLGDELPFVAAVDGV